MVLGGMRSLVRVNKDEGGDQEHPAGQRDGRHLLLPRPWHPSRGAESVERKADAGPQADGRTNPDVASRDGSAPWCGPATPTPAKHRPRSHYSAVRGKG